MENLLQYTRLYDIYKRLLNENEQNIFAYYFEENYSLQEIADVEGVSKARIGAVVKKIEQKLDNFEEKLKLQEKFDLIKSLIKDTNTLEKIDKIIIE